MKDGLAFCVALLPLGVLAICGSRHESRLNSQHAVQWEALLAMA